MPDLADMPKVKFEFKLPNLFNYEFCDGSASVFDSSSDHFTRLPYLKQLIQFQLCNMH